MGELNKYKDQGAMWGREAEFAGEVYLRKTEIYAHNCYQVTSTPKNHTAASF